GRTDKNGQFVLVIDGSQHTPDELFEQAQLAEENGDVAGAERLYRILMKSDPTDASAPFNLGNLFRAVARNVEAEAALRAATRADPTFAEAWYNLSDLLDEQGRSEAAIECLRTQHYRLHPITPMQFSISHCYYSEKTNMRTLRITGAVISATIANLNGLLGHADRYLLGRAMPRCKRACTGIAFLRSPVQNGTGQAGELVPMGNVNLIVRCRVDSYTLVYSGI